MYKTSNTDFLKIDNFKMDLNIDNYKIWYIYFINKVLITFYELTANNSNTETLFCYSISWKTESNNTKLLERGFYNDTNHLFKSYNNLNKVQNYEVIKYDLYNWHTDGIFLTKPV